MLWIVSKRRAAVIYHKFKLEYSFFNILNMCGLAITRVIDTAFIYDKDTTGRIFDIIHNILRSLGLAQSLHRVQFATNADLAEGITPDLNLVFT